MHSVYFYYLLKAHETWLLLKIWKLRNGVDWNLIQREFCLVIKEPDLCRSDASALQHQQRAVHMVLSQEKKPGSGFHEQTDPFLASPPTPSTSVGVLVGLAVLSLTGLVFSLHVTNLCCSDSLSSPSFNPIASICFNLLSVNNNQFRFFSTEQQMLFVFPKS